jgi:hypothetical protein
MTTDDWQHHSVQQLSKQKITWNTALWSYLQEWVITLPPQSAGTMLRYKIGAKLQGSSKILYADSQSESFETATHFSIWYGDDALPGLGREGELSIKSLLIALIQVRINHGIHNRILNNPLVGRCWESLKKCHLSSRWDLTPSG